MGGGREEKRVEREESQKRKGKENTGREERGEREKREAEGTGCIYNKGLWTVGFQKQI